MMVACGPATVPALPAAAHTLAGSAAPQLHLLRRPSRSAVRPSEADKLFRKAWLGTLSMRHLCASAMHMQDGSAAEHFAVVRAEFGPQASDPLDHTRQLWAREEERWLREEQRWLREEQRWERERSRMEAQEAQRQQNEALLLAQVAELRAELAAANAQLALSSTPTTAPPALPSSTQRSVVGSTSINSPYASPKSSPASQSASPKTSSTQSTQSASPKAAVGNAAGATASTTKAAASVSPSAASLKPTAPSASSLQKGAAATNAAGQKRPTLRKGADGDLVQELQIRLEELGFYSGEEEMEFFMFSTQTEDAVMSFQASAQLKEDGIVGPSTWSRLFPLQSAKADTITSTASSKPPTAERTSAPGMQAAGKPTAPLSVLSGSNGVTTSASAKTHQPSAKATVARPESDRYATTKAQGNLQERRVYLLGENRWEEPDRLIAFNSTGELRPARSKACHTCQGPGVVVCSECEGTGQMNVEEQFMEWVEEGEQHCPYCAGVGSTTCDACEGTGMDK